MWWPPPGRAGQERLGIIAVLTLRRQRTVSGARPGVPTRFGPKIVGIIVTCGAFDVGANLLFGVASTTGPLAIVAVLGSLYPAGTVLLARLVDKERLSAIQNAGVVTALAGVAMIAAGS